MPMQEFDEIVANADSKGMILDYLNGGSTARTKGVMGRSASFNTAEVLKVVTQDPAVKGAIISLVDKFAITEWGVYKESGAFDKKKSRELSKLRYNKLARKIVANAILYNNAFVEIRSPGKVQNLNILETGLMRIDAEDNGDIIGYYQDTSDQKNKPYWQPEEIVHYKFDEITTNVWSEFNIEAIYETVLLKDYIRQWMSWFFGTNQLRPVFIIQNGNKAKIKDFISYLKATEKKLTKPLPIEGDVSISTLQKFADEGKSALEVLKWCDEQILMLMQVPPITMGKPDASGRSNSVEQDSALAVRIRSLQKQIADENTYELFPKIGFDSFEFKYGVLDISEKTKIFENVQLMRNAMFTEDAIKEYLEAEGMTFQTSKLLKDPIELQNAKTNLSLRAPDVKTGNEGSMGNKSADAAPSRQRQSTGSASKATLVKNAKPDFTKYPYVMQ